MVTPSWRAKSKRCKDAGSGRSGGYGRDRGRRSAPLCSRQGGTDYCRKGALLGRCDSVFFDHRSLFHFRLLSDRQLFFHQWLVHDHLGLRTAVALLADARLLADAAAQVIELGPVDVADGGHVDLLDLWRVQREWPLHADTEGLLADGERLANARALTLDDDALEHLDAAALALDHLEVHAHRVARLEAGHFAQLGALDRVDDVAHGKGGPQAGGQVSEKSAFLGRDERLEHVFPALQHGIAVCERMRSTGRSSSGSRDFTSFF